MNPLIDIVSKSLYSLPSPSHISSMWNFGSLLGLCLMVQLISGVFLACNYSGDTQLAFSSVSHIMRNVDSGWAIRVSHTNGASLFFIFLFLHVGRGLYFSSFFLKETWLTGISLFLGVMATAFLGYVLPWGQMSLWGAMVITSLFSVIPLMGDDIMHWLWGGFSVENPTLTRFLALHSALPFVLAGLTMLHLLYLHQTGSSNPLGVSSDSDKIPFNPYFSWKDLLGVFFTFLLFVIVITAVPWSLGDPENFIPANPMLTPPHIQPEWYFLFAYAILRAMPNKLGGVVSLVAAVTVFYIFPLMLSSKFKGVKFFPLMKISFWGLVMTFLLLTWIGGCSEVGGLSTLVSLHLTGVYFFFIFMLKMGANPWATKF